MAGYVGVAPGTTTLQLEDGSTIQLTDYIDSAHWGTAELENSDTTSVSVFAAGINGTIPGGTRTTTRVDTNVPRAGDNGLPTAWEFYVYSIGTSYMRATRPTSGSSIANLSTYSNRVNDGTAFGLNRLIYCEYKYNRKDFAQGLLEDFPAGSGVYWQGTATASEVVSNGVPSPRDAAAMVLPIWEREGNSYAFTLYPEVSITISQTAADAGTALTFVDVRAKKRGLIKRPVT